MDCYAIRLDGQGDVTTCLVNKETYDWVVNGGPTPATQISKALANAADESAEFIERLKKEMANPGDSDNDRALCASPDYGEIFYDTKSLVAFCVKNNINIVEDYEGYIY